MSSLQCLVQCTAFIVLVSCVLTQLPTQMNLGNYEPLYTNKLYMQSQNPLFNQRVAKNVILVLVEGLDTHTMAVARKQAHEKGFPLMEDLWEISGLLKTPSRDFLVSDPAATVSAMFNGLPEYNGQMGWVEQGDSNCTGFDPSKKLLKNLFKVMADAGKLTALATPTSLTSPGVAGTYASTPDQQIESDLNLRESECNGGSFKDIAQQLIFNYKNLNVVLGSGIEKFVQKDSTYPGGRSDKDLVDFWKMEKNLRGRPNKAQVDFDLGDVDTFLADNSSQYFFGLLQPGNSGANILGEGVANYLRNKDNPNGFFLTVYADFLARQHEKANADALVVGLKEVLSFVSMVKNFPDTLIVLASTQGSTLTLASGSLLAEKLDSFSQTEDCEKFYYMNYAFGPQPLLEEKRTIENKQYRSMYKDTSGITGGSDLPVFAMGPGAQVFSGINDLAYVYHALLYATCQSQDGDASTIYDHCQSQVPTTTTATTSTTRMPTTTPKNIPWPTLAPTPAPTPSRPPTTQVPPTFRPPPPTYRPPRIPIWPFQPTPQPFGNPYGGYRIIGGSRPLPNPSPIPNTNTNTNTNNNAFSWASLFPFFL